MSWWSKIILDHASQAKYLSFLLSLRKWQKRESIRCGYFESLTYMPCPEMLFKSSFLESNRTIFLSFLFLTLQDPRERNYSMCTLELPAWKLTHILLCLLINFISRTQQAQYVLVKNGWESYIWCNRVFRLSWNHNYEFLLLSYDLSSKDVVLKDFRWYCSINTKVGMRK